MPRIQSSIRLASFGLAFLLAWGCQTPGAHEGPVPYSWQGETMGTTYTVKVVEPALSEAEQAGVQKTVDRELDAVNQLMSTYLADSELSRLNQAEASEPYSLSPETIGIFVVARQVGELTGGAFDITVGPLVNAWGFGPPGKRPSPPSEDEIARLANLVGWDKIIIDEDAATVVKSAPGVYCDLSAIAKGYAVDRLSATLAGLGYVQHMVEVGGEVRTKGHNANGEPWRIGIEKPIEGGRSVQRVLPLADRALATSGDYRNYYEEGGRRISHEIDPRSGQPIAHLLAAVTVVSESCAVADALATGLLVLGEEEGYRIAVKHNIAAFFLIREEGAFVEKTSPRFDEIFADGSAGGEVRY